MSHCRVMHGTMENYLGIASCKRDSMAYCMAQCHMLQRHVRGPRVPAEIRQVARPAGLPRLGPLGKLKT